MKILENIKRSKALITLNVLVLLLFLVNSAGFVKLPFIPFLENYANDARIKVSAQKNKDPRIVIIDIDEKSLAAEGRWPWGRDKMARMLALLFDHYEVSLVGFDVVFAEPDNSSGLAILEQLADGELSAITEYRQRLEQIRDNLDFDNLFARSMDGRPVVLGYFFNLPAEGKKSSLKNGMLPPPVLTNADFHKPPLLKKAAGYGANLEILQSHATTAGHFNPNVDEDGIMRRVPLLYEFEGGYYESLSLAMVRQIMNVDRIVPVLASDVTGNYSSLEWLRVGRISIPVDDDAQAIIPYRGRQGSFPYISATDVLNLNADKKVLENAYVLVGTTAPGLFDLRSTPVQKEYAGVEIHANLIAGMLDGKIKQKPKYVQAIEFLHLLIIGLIITFLLPLLTPVWSMLVTSALLLASVGFNYLVWHQIDIVLPIAAVITMILVLLLLNMSYGFFFERRIKGQITELFGQYVPPELVDEMSDDPTSYTREAEVREMTVLFSDVRGFTTLSEGLNPKELSSLMNEFLSELTGVIHQHRGTIDKYMGDAIMAFWGAPVRDPEHARHALNAGLAMIEKMYALRDDFEDRGWPRLAIGVGINTGKMSVGNMGSKFRTAYTVIGDDVNLGSRLEGLTKQYGVNLIVGENTRNALSDYVYRELDLVRVKGKHRPVAVFEPIAIRAEVSHKELEEVELYHQALNIYRKQEWDAAESCFNNLKDNHDYKDVYDVYLERIRYYRKNSPGTNWDGVFTFTTK